jgi:hypothetical protein
VRAKIEVYKLIGRKRVREKYKKRKDDKERVKRDLVIHREQGLELRQREMEREGEREA